MLMNLINRQMPMPLTTYYEKKIGRTIYRITTEYSGKIDFATALGELTVRKILRDEKGRREQNASK